jgi:glycosyltransferase involved in cell wall biosynthesis
LPVHWIIADDGSDGDEALRYAELRERFAKIYPQVDLHRSETRSRKGGAVYDAWHAAGPADYYAFVDADGAVSPETILRLLRLASEEPERRAVVGVRALTGDLAAKRSWSRKCVFRGFRALVRALLGFEFGDTQCGAKVIPGPAYRAIAARLKERGFIFDIELLVALRCSSVGLREEPIAWKEVAGSRVRLLRDALHMLRGLWRIRRRMRAGRYAGH